MKTKVVQILIYRSLTSQPSDVVFAHEVPILKVIRGAAAVEVTDTDCSGFDLKPVEVLPRNELIRLKNKYKRFIRDGQHPVDVAYPDGSRDLELYYKDPSQFDSVGADVVEDAFDDSDPFNPVPVPKAPGATTAPTPEPETPEPENTQPTIDLRDRPAVINALTELDVQYSKNSPTVHLASLLTKTQEEQAAAQAE